MKVSTDYIIESDPKTIYRINIPSESGWVCHLFGCENLTLHPKEGDVPNWFWRKMQYLILGNKWVKK